MKEWWNDERFLWMNWLMIERWVRVKNEWIDRWLIEDESKRLIDGATNDSYEWVDRWFKDDESEGLIERWMIGMNELIIDW